MVAVLRPSWRTWWWAWIVANVLGVGAGLALAWGVGRALARVGGEPPLAPGTAGPALLEFGLVLGLAGLAAGAMQWLVLRRLLRGMRWWVVASIVGLAAGVVVMGLGFGLSVGVFGEESTTGLALAALAAGALPGMAQSLLLRRQVAGAGIWVAASAAGFAAAVLLFLLLTRGGDANLLGIAAGGAVAGGLYGVNTGAALVWLLRRPRREPA